MRDSLMCPSRGADRLWSGGDPTALQDAVLGLLEDADLPTEINDKIMLLVAEGEEALASPALNEGVSKEGLSVSQDAAGACLSAAPPTSAVPSAWQSIESAPKDGTRVLTYGCLHEDGEHGGETPAIQLSQHVGGWFSAEWGGHEPVLWQPLPATPGAGSGGIAATASERCNSTKPSSECCAENANHSPEARVKVLEEALRAVTDDLYDIGEALRVDGRFPNSVSAIDASVNRALDILTPGDTNG